LLKGIGVFANAHQTPQDVVDGSKHDGKAIFAFKSLFFFFDKRPSQLFLALFCLLPAEEAKAAALCFEKLEPLIDI
jgi:hypothetical protein